MTLGRVALMLLAVAGCDALHRDPWEIEPDVRVLLEVVRDGVPVAEVPVGEGGLSLFHRIDVFRAREYTTRGHETHRECVPRSTGNGPVEPAPHCTSLTTGADGGNLTAADLAAGAQAFLSAKQAVLHTLHSSPPLSAAQRPMDPTGPLTVEGSVSSLDRYWAKYWAHCRGCLGLVWIEASDPAGRYCTRPLSPAVGDGDFRVQVDLVRDRVAASAIEQEKDQPLCGDASWFQALWRDNQELNFR
jgi:hypothetical protein